MINYALVCPNPECRQRFEACAPHTERYEIKSPCCSLAPCETDFEKQRIARDGVEFVHNTELMGDAVDPSEVAEARELFGDTVDIREDGSFHVRDTKQLRRFHKRRAEIEERGTADFLREADQAADMARQTGQVVVPRD